MPGSFRIPDQLRSQVLAKIYSKPCNRLFLKADSIEAGGVRLTFYIDGPLKTDNRIHSKAQRLKPAIRGMRVGSPEHQRFRPHWRVGNFLASGRLAGGPAEQFDISAVKRDQAIHRAKVMHC